MKKRCLWTSMLTLCAACGMESDRAAKQEESAAEYKLAAPAAEPPAPPGSPAPMKKARAKARGGSGLADDETSNGEIAGLEMDKAERTVVAPEEQAMPASKPEAEAAAVRAWFPETFIFEPIIETDASGRAVHEVRAPDRLTTWRILGLAHDRQGQQAGTIARFSTTMPIYVDPVVPPFMMTKDELRLPVQVVNTTDRPQTSKLAIEVRGARLRSETAKLVTVAPGGTHIEWVGIIAERAGTVTLRASLGSADVVERQFEVRATGRPITVERSGTLAAPRSLAIEPPPGLEGELRARLEVYPGALAVLRSELAGGAHRRGPLDDAYLLFLAEAGPSLLEKLGEAPDHDELRKLGLIAGQRALRRVQTSELFILSLFAQAVSPKSDNPIVARMAERLSFQIEQAQRADGSFGGGRGETLQRILVTTAEAALAIGDRPGVKIRASATFERHLGRIEDAYTAASVLASGAVSGSVADRLVEVLEKGIETNKDGSKVVKVEPGLVRSDGVRPTAAEASALAVVALAGREAQAALRADLGASVLGAYRPAFGWGDGRANMIGLRAVISLFDRPLPDRIRITLRSKGAVLAEGELAGERRREVLVLETRLAAPSELSDFEVIADPPTPGLGFRFSLRGYGAWPEPSADGGLELRTEIPSELVVGRSAEIQLSAVAPAGQDFAIHQGLPAGVSVEPDSLQRLVSEGVLRAFSTEDGRVELQVAGLSPGQTFSAKLRVVPSFAGTLQASAARIELPGGESAVLPPRAWRIR